MSAQVTITQLPAAGAITGTESVPIVQNGQTVRTTTGAIAASPNQTQTFITVNQEPTLPNSRYLGATNGLTLSASSPQGVLNITTTGALSSLVSSGTGLQVKTDSVTLTGRTIAAGTTGLSVANGDGISGNPTITLTGNVLALAGVSANGLLKITTAGAVGATSITGTANQVAVTNGDGVAGAPTVGLASNVILPGTASATLPIGVTADRPISPVNGMVRYNSTTAGFEGYSAGAWGPIGGGGTVSSITAGTGLSGGVITTSGTIAINATGVTAGTYTYPTLAINAQGQVTSAANGTAPITSITGTAGAITATGSPAVTLNLAAALDFSGKTISAGAFTGAIIDSSSIGNTTPSTGAFTSILTTSISTTNGTILDAPTAATSITNKSYVDSVAIGLKYHAACQLATTAALPSCTYNNGSSGVGATLTATANAALTVDSVAVTVGQRILVKNQVAGLQNGVYDVTQTGSGAAPFILTRSTDYNTGGTGYNQVNTGDYLFIQLGTTNANSSWVQTTLQPITIGTTALVFTQFSAGVTSYTAGTGLTLSVNQFSITNTGVTSGTYGSGAIIPVFAVNAQGQLTSVTNTAIVVSGGTF